MSPLDAVFEHVGSIQHFCAISPLAEDGNLILDIEAANNESQSSLRPV